MIVINKIDIPFVQEISNDEEILLEQLWKKYCGPYIVSPVSHDQALYIMWEDLPYFAKKMNFTSPFIIRNKEDDFKYHYLKQ